jgi:regulatory LuxR family protein
VTTKPGDAVSIGYESGLVNVGHVATLTSPGATVRLAIRGTNPGDCVQPVLEIAAEMCVSVNRVKTHLAAIYRKLTASRRKDAVLRARELELL